MTLPFYVLVYAARHQRLTNKVRHLSDLTRPTAIESARLEDTRLTLALHCYDARNCPWLSAWLIDTLLIDSPEPHPQPLTQ